MCCSVAAREAASLVDVISRSTSAVLFVTFGFSLETAALPETNTIQHQQSAQNHPTVGDLQHSSSIVGSCAAMHTHCSALPSPLISILCHIVVLACRSFYRDSWQVLTVQVRADPCCRHSFSEGDNCSSVPISMHHKERRALMYCLMTGAGTA